MGEEKTFVRYELADIKRAISVPDLMAREMGVEWTREGDQWLCACPFHSERTPSFRLHEGKEGWWGKCFGCDAKGDVFALWSLFKGYGKTQFRQAVQELAEFAGIAGRVETKGKKKKAEPVKAVESELHKQLQRERISLPVLRPLKWETCVEIAKLRGLRPEGVWSAAKEGLVWGQYLGVSVYGELVWGEKMERLVARRGLRIGPVRCWVVSDGEGFSMEARRLDGEKWKRHDGGEFKSWGLGTSSWPTGAALIGARKNVVVVEGAPDLLAAHDFIHRVHGPEGVNDYAVVAVLGAAVKARADALRHFAGKRVRLFPDADPVKFRLNKTTGEPVLDKETGEPVEVCPGRDGAYKWQEALVKAGAEVDAVDLQGMVRADGEPVKDLNDLALSDAAWLDGEECRGFFTF